MSLATLAAPASLTLWLEPRDSAAEHAEKLRAQEALASADKATLAAMRQQWRGESTPKVDDRPLWQRKPTMELAEKLVAECRARAPQDRPIVGALPINAIGEASHTPRKPSKAQRKLQRAAEYNRQHGPSVKQRQEAICAAIMSDSAVWLEVSAEPCEPDAGAPLVSIVDRHGRFALVPVEAADAITQRAHKREEDRRNGVNVIGARGGACRQITGHGHVPVAKHSTPAALAPLPVDASLVESAPTLARDPIGADGLPDGRLGYSAH